MIRLADETATEAARPERNPAGEYRPARCLSTRDMSAHVMRHTNGDPGVASAHDVDCDGLDMALDVRGRHRRSIGFVATTLLMPGSPAVTSPPDHRRR
jgi:hypothetical protein